MPHPTLPVRLGRAAACLALALAAGPLGGTAQEGPPTEPREALERAREQQAAFERLRRSRIPVSRLEGEGSCDQRIGRICIWFGGAEEESFPPEPPETDRARRGLIGVLLETYEVVRTPWLLGQLVHYLVEQRDPRYAEQVAGDCGIEETWWCHALLGYSRHVRGAWLEAEDDFADALATMPDDVRREWTGLGYLLTGDALDELEDLPEEEAEARRALFWSLSDPLFLVPGNDRRTDHLARWVEARNQEDAENPQGMFWEEDLEEVLVRYGRNTGYSRTHNPERVAPMQLQDTRRVVGHHDPGSRGYIFPERFLEAPADVPPESWITAPREARAWYAPPYAPDMRALETQVGRFRRGDRMLVVAAWRPDPAPTAAGLAEDPFRAVPDDVEAALFLLPESGGAPLRFEADGAEGVLAVEARPGRWVSSLEVLDEAGGRAWRARQGVKQEPIFPGQVAVSDLLLLREGAPAVDSLAAAVPHVRPGVRIRVGEELTLAWEVYGLGVQEPVGVTVGFTRGRPGFLERVGEFLGVVEPDRPVEITFSDTGPDRVETVFRSLDLTLPELEPGEYTLHLRLDLPRGEPVLASRPVYVEAGPGGG